MTRSTDKKGFIPKVFCLPAGKAGFFSFFVFWLTCYLSFSPPAFAQAPQQDVCPEGCMQEDTLVVETYYPSPYGLYEELRGDKIIVGDTAGSVIGSIEATLPPAGTLTFKPLTSEPLPSSGTIYEGSMYYDDYYNKFRYYDGSDWTDVGGGGAYWDQSLADSKDIYYTQSGNVGIGVGASDAVGAKLQVKPSYRKIGLVVKNGAAGSYAVWTRSSSGAYSYSVPLGISSVRITAYGAQGGGPYGGLGGMAQATVNVTPGETLYVYVGGQNGYNGGGWGRNYGGGASDIRRGGTAFSNRIIVAGGGGSEGEENGHHPGGVGGGSTGGSGSGTYPGGGGGQGSGGGGGGGNQPGSSGTFGVGGNSLTSGSGGGGGGYYGGGGGGDSGDGGDQTSGGGGGSGYVTGSNTLMSSGVHSGDGKVVIDPLPAESNSLMEWQDENGSAMNIVDIYGNLALGSSTANNYKLYVNGSAYTTGSTWATSDLRFKENILPLNNSLDKILNIQPVSFDWNNSGYPDMNFEQNRQIGLVAQEVEKEIPELVRTDTNGYKSIAYDKLTVVTIEAVKEQQEEIEQLKDALRAQEERNQKKLRNQQKEIELLKAEKELRN